jgi:hypothetical protein
MLTDVGPRSLSCAGCGDATRSHAADSAAAVGLCPRRSAVGRHGPAGGSRLDPEAYLADVLARINEHLVTRLDELLPWNWAQSLREAARAA